MAKRNGIFSFEASVRRHLVVGRNVEVVRSGALVSECGYLAEAKVKDRLQSQRNSRFLRGNEQEDFSVDSAYASGLYL